MKKPLLARAGRLLGALAVGTTLFSVIALSGAVPAGAVGVSGGGLVSHKDTPDPDVVYSGHGTTYYTYSTGTMGLVTADWTNGGIGFTSIGCTSGGCGTNNTHHVALTAYTHPSIPRGLDLGLFGLQAPSVVHLNSGTWVMYYGGVYVTNPHNAYAVWDATATNPTAVDGFTSPLTEGPLMYQASTGGSTDPSVFTSPSGTHSLQWKSSTYAGDGHLAQLWSMPLTSTALQVSGSPSSLITQPGAGYWDSATIENPDMIYSGGAYYLFFSGGLWWHRSYAEGYVTCSSASGGCSSPTAASFLHSTTGAPYGPGGASLFPSATGSWQIAYHGWTRACSRYTEMTTPTTPSKLAPTQTPTTHTQTTSCDGSRQLYVSQMTGLAATPLPKITSFTASPSSLPWTGGTVTFSVTSPNMTNYSISSSPAVAGLPAERPTIHLPANTSGSPITYTFTVTTNNTVGFETATTSVTVNAMGAIAAYETGSTLLETCGIGSNGTGTTTCYEGVIGFASGARLAVTSTSSTTAMVAYENGNGRLETCAVASDGVATCSQAGYGLASGAQPVITSTGSGTAKVAFDSGAGLLDTCAVASSGAVTGCYQDTIYGFASGTQPVITSTGSGTATAAFHDGAGWLDTCAVASSGAGTCSRAGYGLASGAQPVITSTGSGTAKVAFDSGAGLLDTCAVASSGAVTGCYQDTIYGFASGTQPVITSTGSGTATAAFHDGAGWLDTCAVASSGAGTCSRAGYGLASGAQPVITSTGSGTAKVAFDSGAGLLDTCAVASSGAVTGCYQDTIYGFASGTQPVITSTGSGTATAAFHDGAGRLETCAVASSGAGTCSLGAIGFASGAQPVITANGSGSEMVGYDNGNGLLETCAVGSSGATTGCYQDTTYGFASGEAVMMVPAG